MRATARNFWNEGEIEQSGERHRYGRAEVSINWAAGRTWQLGSSVAYTSGQFTSIPPRRILASDAQRELGAGAPSPVALNR